MATAPALVGGVPSSGASSGSTPAASVTTSSAFTLACTGFPAITQLTFVKTTVSGRITPDPVVGDSTATLSTLLLHVVVKKALAALAHGNDLAVTVTMAGTVTGASPSTISLEFHAAVTVPTTATASIPPSGLSITAPGTASPATLTAASSGTVSLGAAVSSSSSFKTTITVTFAGVSLGPYDCANPAVPVASATIQPVTSALTLGTTSLPAATVTVPYSATLTATGGETPYTWSATGLPAWASLDASTGVITGTPTALGTSTVTVTVASSTGQRMTRTLPLDVRPPPLTVATTSLPPGVVTAPYTATLTATGGETPYTWSATGLPAWASLDASTGVITGTPTAPLTSTVTVTVSDHESPPARASGALRLSIAPPLSLATTSLPGGSATVPYTATLTATGGETPYTWSATGLPTWASLDASTGVITGTPTVAMTSTVTVTVSDHESPSASRSAVLSLVVQPTPLGVVTSGLPEAAVAAPYSATLRAIGGTRPYTWSATGLPAWASLDPTTGTITGTPTATGTAHVRVTVRDAASSDVSVTLTLTVEPALGLVTASLPAGATTVPYHAALVATGGLTPYRWSATGLPDGLDLSATGVVTGTPAAAGTSTVTVTVGGATGVQVRMAFVVEIQLTPLHITTSSLPDAVVGAAYTTTLAAVGGDPPDTWSATGLPAGLFLSRTGVVTGTPETPGAATAVLTVTDAESPAVSAAATLSLTVQPRLAVATARFPGATAGSPYSATLSATGGIPPYTWSATGLPAGLTVTPTGTISGTPAAPVTTAVTVRVHDAEQPVATAAAAVVLAVGAATAPPGPAAGNPGCSSGTATRSTSSAGGYWLAGADGALYSCGSATFDGSLTALGVTPTRPIVGIAAAPTGRGYWEVASDGGVFAFGPGAAFYGSMGGTTLHAPVVGIAAAPTGRGYWEVASDGGVFAFGPGAAFYGSMGGTTLHAPVVGIAAAPTGRGYWEVASDGGVFAFGPGAPFHGSTACHGLAAPAVAIAATPGTDTGGGTDCGFTSAQPAGGYRVVASDGGVFAFGNAPFEGSLAGDAMSDIVGVAEA
jgi:hypothetical protein